MIADFLAEGKENARTGRELATLFGCDIRTITEQIERERRDGQPICAISRGRKPGLLFSGRRGRTAKLLRQTERQGDRTI